MTLSFSEFWNWLIAHPNCILRAGTTDMLFYDEEDFHWHFGEDDGAMVVQVMRGKRVLGELFVDPRRIVFVQELPSETEEEHVFEVMSESQGKTFPSYVFALTHGYEEDPSKARGRIH